MPPYREFVPDAGFRHYEQSLRVVELLEHGTGRMFEDAATIPRYRPRSARPEPDVGSARRHRPAQQRPQRSDRHHDGTRRTLEGKAVRIADRVAYINHDIDDALRAGVHQARTTCPAKRWRRWAHSHSERIANMVIDIVMYSDGKPLVEMSPPIAAATDRLKEFMFERVYWNAATGNQDLRKSQHVIRFLFRLYMEQPELMNGNAALCVLPLYRARRARLRFRRRNDRPLRGLPF